MNRSVVFLTSSARLPPAIPTEVLMRRADSLGRGAPLGSGDLKPVLEGIAQTAKTGRCRMRRQLRACLIAVSLVVANIPGALAAAFTFTTIDVPGGPTGINNTGQIVGSFFDAAGVRGYLLSGGTLTMIHVSGVRDTFATGINGTGQIVGWSGAPFVGTHGYVLSGATFTTIDVPGARSTVASGINDTGQIVGTFVDAAGEHGYVLSGATFTTIDVPGARSTVASGINDTGQIVGTLVDAAGAHGYVLSGA